MQVQVRAMGWCRFSRFFQNYLPPAKLFLYLALNRNSVLGPNEYHFLQCIFFQPTIKFQVLLENERSMFT